MPQSQSTRTLADQFRRTVEEQAAIRQVVAYEPWSARGAMHFQAPENPLKSEDLMKAVADRHKFLSLYGVPNGSEIRTADLLAPPGCSIGRCVITAHGVIFPYTIPGIRQVLADWTRVVQLCSGTRAPVRYYQASTYGTSGTWASGIGALGLGSGYFSSVFGQRPH